MKFLLSALSTSLSLLASLALAQGPGSSPVASHLVIPQARAYLSGAGAPGSGGEQVVLIGVSASVDILEQVAATTLEIALENRGRRQEEAELLVPVPEGAVVRSFLFEGSALEPTARLLPLAEARATYESIVRKLRDPALLEFAGYNLIKSSVFPVPPGGTQKVRLTYEQVIPADGPRVDYVLPRSESVEAGPWKIEVRVRSARPITTVYSPSHPLLTDRSGPGALAVRVAPDGAGEPGPFRLSYLLSAVGPSGDGVTASLLAYPDHRVGGGYFLLLAGLPPDLKAGGPRPVGREVIFVIDRSGSMAGEKLEQARAAALQSLEGLEEGEAFNIIDYASTVERFSPRPVRKDPVSLAEARRYLRGLRASSGTNLHDALLEALRQPRAEGDGPDLLPLVLFLTDGLPTVGETREGAIRDAAAKVNAHRRRVFTMGVGYDVNGPLLTGLARSSRGSSAFVLPGENVEVKVSEVFERLHGPVLADPGLETLDESGEPTTRAVRDVIPGKIPDLFRGDQLVLLGQYRGEAPLSFRLTGNYLGRKRDFRFRFTLEGATTRNSFVPRLWASRKIAALVDEIRQRGAETPGGTPSSSAPAYRGTGTAGPAGAPAGDPRFRELVDEIVRLSTEHGILTEYTAFLALEGTDLARKDMVLAEAGRELAAKAVATRSGIGSVNQELNSKDQIGQSCLNRTNKYWNERMSRVEVSNVRQVCDRAFFRRGSTWVDSSLLEKLGEAPDQVIGFGTPAHRELMEKLEREGRQGLAAFRGEALIVVEGKTVLLRGPDR